MSEPEVERLLRELREREEFQAFAAHELRNPLHSMGMQLSSIRRALLGDTLDRNRLLERVTHLQRSLGHYTERATLLLDLAQQNAQAYAVQPRPVDLAGYLADFVDHHADEAGFHRCTLRYVGPASRSVFTDVQAIDHVVGNLLSNAFKYAQARSIEIGLEADSTHARIWVADDGCGIPHDQQERIFGKFQRGDLLRGESGYGLGLWIVRRLTEALGGTIDLKSAPGAGCRFVLEIPMGVGPT